MTTRGVDESKNLICLLPEGSVKGLLNCRFDIETDFLFNFVSQIFTPPSPEGNILAIGAVIVNQSIK